MKIVNIEAILFRLPIRKEIGPTKSSIWSMDAADHILIKIDTDESITGFGEALQRPTIYGETQQSVVAIIDSWIGPSLIGMDPFCLEQIWSKLDRMAANSTAKGAIDMALHDIQGKKLGLPVYKLLGGWRNGTVRASALLSADAPEKTAAAALAWKQQYGIDSFKIKVGMDSNRDVEAFIAIRQAVGDDATLYVDANQAWAPDEAIRIIKQISPYGLAWVEEPIKSWDFEGKRRVAGHIDVPVLLDESVITPQDVMHHIRMGIGDMFSIKTSRTGFYNSRKIVQMAESANIPCLVGTARETGIGAVANAQFAASAKNILLGELTEFKIFEETLLKHPLKLSDGYFFLPDGDGLGVEVDMELVERYRIS